MNGFDAADVLRSGNERPFWEGIYGEKYMNECGGDL